MIDPDNPRSLHGRYGTIIRNRQGEVLGTKWREAASPTPSISQKQVNMEIQQTNVDAYKIMFSKMSESVQSTIASALLSTSQTKEESAILQSLHKRGIDLEDAAVALGIQSNARRDQDIREAMGGVAKSGDDYALYDTATSLAAKLEDSGLAYKYKRWMAKAQAENGNLLYQKLTDPMGRTIDGVHAGPVDLSKTLSILESRQITKADDTGSWDNLKAVLHGTASGKSSDVLPVIDRNEFGARSIPDDVAARWSRGIQTGEDTRLQLTKTLRGDPSIGSTGRSNYKLDEAARGMSWDDLTQVPASDLAAATGAFGDYVGTVQHKQQDTGWFIPKVDAKQMIAEGAARTTANPVATGDLNRIKGRLFHDQQVQTFQMTGYKPDPSNIDDLNPYGGRYQAYDTKSFGSFPGITGSRIGAFMGNNPYESREDAIRKAVFNREGLAKGGAANADTARGNILEAAIAEYFSQTYPEWLQREDNRLRFDIENPSIGAIPDRYLKHAQTGEEAVLEIKSVQKFEEQHHYRDQLQAEMLATGRKKAILLQERWDEFRGEYKYTTFEEDFDPNWAGSDAAKRAMADISSRTPKEELEKMLGREISDREYQTRTDAAAYKKFQEESIASAESIYGSKGAAKELLSDKYSEVKESPAEAFKKATAALSGFTAALKVASAHAAKMNLESETAYRGGYEYGDYTGMSVAFENAGLSEGATQRVLANAGAAVGSVSRSPSKLSGILSEMITANAMTGGKGFDVSGVATSLLTGDRRELLTHAQKYSAANNANQSAAVLGALGLEEVKSAKSLDLVSVQDSSNKLYSASENFTKAVNSFQNIFSSAARGNNTAARESRFSFGASMDEFMYSIMGMSEENREVFRRGREARQQEYRDRERRWEEKNNQPIKVEVQVTNDGDPVKTKGVNVYQPSAVGG